jgi:methyl-accepting chemotaxis protein
MTMTRPLRSSSALLAFAAAVAAFAPPASAAQPRRAAPEASADDLTPQEREMLTLGNEFARRCTEAIQGWVSKKEVSVDQLFSFLYYPMPDTDPPKFTTDYDKLSDRDILAIEEDILAQAPTIIFTVLVDKNGYLPTHDQRYSQPLTGNKASDLVNNRTKRIFNDRTGLAAAQNTAPFLIQKYQRDTGETMADLSVPIFIDGRHWGAVRIGYRHLEPR